MKTNQIILIIIGGLILVGLFFVFGYQLGQKSVVQLEQKSVEEKMAEEKTEVVVPEFLTSKVVQKWHAVASGEVVEISGRTLTLRYKGDTLTIPISDAAKIYLLGAEEKKEKAESVRFEEIRVGNKVDISVAIVEGNLITEVVNILPPK